MSANISEYLQKIEEYFQTFSFKELGINFVIGFLIGFFLKKGLKIFFFLIALAVVFFFLFYSNELKDLNSDVVLNNSDKIVAILEKSFIILKNIFSFFESETLPIIVIGFFVGFKLG